MGIHVEVGSFFHSFGSITKNMSLISSCEHIGRLVIYLKHTILRSRANMISRRIYLTIIASLSSCLSFASYDGRLADDPYHKSPTGVYIILIIAIVCAIVKGVPSKNNKSADMIRKKSETKSKPVTKVYQETGRYWDECPSCKGSGWIEGKEISYLFAPLETVCCDQCKGYGHQLTLEAEFLHAEYRKQYDEEQTKERNLRIQKEKVRLEEKKRVSEERRQRKQQAIANIKSAGRSVLKEDEYLKQIEKLRAKRKEIGKKIMSILDTEPLCTSCQNKKPIKDCPICRGTGHIVTEEANRQIDIWLELLIVTKQLYSDFQALYPQDTDSRFHISSIENLKSLFDRTQNNKPPKSILMREKIVKLLENEPYCPHCMGFGYLKVILDHATNKAYEQIACCRCNGCGRLYYN